MLISIALCPALHNIHSTLPGTLQILVSEVFGVEKTGAGGSARYRGVEEVQHLGGQAEGKDAGLGGA